MLCQCSHISFLLLDSRQMSLFGKRLGCSSPASPESRIYFLISSKLKGFGSPSLVAFPPCLLSLDEALCVARQLASGNKHWSKEDNSFLFLSYQSCQRTIPPSSPSVPFITGFVLTQLSFWPHPPQPGSEISGSGIRVSLCLS